MNVDDATILLKNARKKILQSSFSNKCIVYDEIILGSKVDVCLFQKRRSWRRRVAEDKYEDDIENNELLAEEV